MTDKKPFRGGASAGTIRSSDRARELSALGMAARRAKKEADQAAARIMRVALAGNLTAEERHARAGELCAIYGVDSSKATRLVVVLLSALDRAVQRGDPESVRLVLGLVGQQDKTTAAAEAAPVPVLIPGGVVPSDVIAQARALEQAATTGAGGGSDG